MKTNFKIDNESLESLIDLEVDSLRIQSSPRPYDVIFCRDVFSAIKRETENKNFSYVFFIDKNIESLYEKETAFMKEFTHSSFEAIEELKTVDAAFDLCDLLLKCNANRKTILYVIGGGIMQDIGAYAAATFKRGIPWVYIPTTLLGMSDSCVGGKTGLNYKHTKNLIALFSAPRKVLIDPVFVKTLDHENIFSGHGEILRLALTGGKNSFELYKNLIKDIQLNKNSLCEDDLNIIEKIIKLSLSVKKAVVEKDEFEINIRKSMNYGHSIGHALEVVTNHKIPHGQAVAIGILVENLIGKKYLSLSDEIINEIQLITKDILSQETIKQLKNISKHNIIDIMTRDKKVEGKYLKLATISDYGNMHFIDFPLNQESEKIIHKCIELILKEL